MPLHKPRLKLKNVLRGIVPTFTGFDTINPSNLSNATDGDITTSTGEAKKTLVAAGDVGYFNFDLGRDTMILFGGLLGLHSSAGTMYITMYIDPAEGNLSTSSYASQAIINVSEQKGYPIPKMGYGRYCRMRLNGSAAGDYYVKLYEAFAYELVFG